MSARTDGSDDDPDRAERKRRYEHVVQCVAVNTTEKQPPGLDRRQLYLHLVQHGSLHHDAAQSALRAAIENDELVPWRDADGVKRLTCADDVAALERARDRLVANIDEWTDDDKAQLGAIQSALLDAGDSDD